MYLYSTVAVFAVVSGVSYAYMYSTYTPQSGYRTSLATKDCAHTHTAVYLLYHHDKSCILRTRSLGRNIQAKKLFDVSSAYLPRTNQQMVAERTSITRYRNSKSPLADSQSEAMYSVLVHREVIFISEAFASPQMAFFKYTVT